MLPIDRVDRRLFGGRTLRGALCTVAVACGGPERWPEKTFGQLNDGQSEAFCVALLANGEPGDHFCDGNSSVVPQPTDGNALNDCVVSLERVRDRDKCADVSTADYFACEEEFSTTGCLHVPEICDGNWWTCPRCDGWWECTLDTYIDLGSSR